MDPLHRQWLLFTTSIANVRAYRCVYIRQRVVGLVHRQGILYLSAMISTGCTCTKQINQSIGVVKE